jgi:hypothetical protein
MLLIHSCGIPEEYISALKRLLPGLELLPLGRQSGVYVSIAAHPDIFLFRLSQDILIYSPSLDEDMLGSISKRGVTLIPSDDMPRDRYPSTVILNAARVGKHVIHNTRVTDGAVKRESLGRGLEFINCSQGYTRCSIVPVDDNTIITQDPGIAKAAQNGGIETLLVSPADIELPGEERGFIGGTSGVLPDGRIAFLGDITEHPDYGHIKGLLDKKVSGAIFLEDMPLYDGGSLIFLR